jgi:hypothetical protein
MANIVWFPVGPRESVGAFAGSGGPAVRCHCRHPDPVRVAPSLRPDMIFGRDRLVAGVFGYTCDQCVTKCVAVLEQHGGFAPTVPSRWSADGPKPLV